MNRIKSSILDRHAGQSFIDFPKDWMEAFADDFGEIVSKAATDEMIESYHSRGKSGELYKLKPHIMQKITDHANVTAYTVIITKTSYNGIDCRVEIIAAGSVLNDGDALKAFMTHLAKKHNLT